MRKVTLGRSGLEVTPICFGCWQMGQTYWGRQPEDLLTDAVRTALELGVNFFDTADAYGDGEAEHILGKALKGVKREDVVVATKVYHHFYEDGRRHPDLSADYIPKACDASLKRLGLDYLDLYQAHAFDPLTPMEETAAAFERLKEVGKIRAYGVSNLTVEQVRTARTYGDYDTIQPRYSLLGREIENDLLPYCHRHNVGVLVYSSLMRGVLTGKFKGDETFDDLRGNDPMFKGEAFRSMIAKVEKLRPMAEAKGCTMTQLSLAATLMHPSIHCAITGIKSPEQIRDCAGAADVQISREEYHAIRATLS